MSFSHSLPESLRKYDAITLPYDTDEALPELSVCHQCEIDHDPRDAYFLQTPDGDDLAFDTLFCLNAFIRGIE